MEFLQWVLGILAFGSVVGLVFCHILSRGVKGR